MIQGFARKSLNKIDNEHVSISDQFYFLFLWPYFCSIDVGEFFLHCKEKTINRLRLIRDTWVYPTK